MRDLFETSMVPECLDSGNVTAGSGSEVPALMENLAVKTEEDYFLMLFALGDICHCLKPTGDLDHKDVVRRRTKGDI